MKIKAPERRRQNPQTIVVFGDLGVLVHRPDERADLAIGEFIDGIAKQAFIVGQARQCGATVGIGHRSWRDVSIAEESPADRRKLKAES